MKRFLALLLTLFTACSLCACVEEMQGGAGSSYPSSESSSALESSDLESSSNKPAAEGFTVRLVLEEGGEMPSLKGVQALWTGKSGVHRASFDEDGFASSEEPDGEYRVTLSSVPDGYTYDPNGYAVNNNRKNATITLYKIKEMSGEGGPYDSNCYKLPSAGTYRFNFTKADQRLYFTFVPNKAGIYRFSTLMDATANEITASFYKHAVQFIGPQEITDTEGAITNTYTKNFIVDVKMSEAELSAAHYFSLAIHSLSKTVFPTYIDLRLERLGDHPGTEKLEQPTIPPVEYAPEGNGTFRFVGYLTGRVLDQKLVGSYDAIGTFTPYIGSDGYYRVDDGSDDGIDNNPILYAKIRGPVAGVLDDGDIQGINDDRVSKRFYNITAVNAQGEKEKKNMDYTAFYNAHNAKVNSDGCIPVTKELRDFLYYLSVCNQYFWDGNGWAETYGGYQSDEESQWLFACGYYF